MASSSLISSTSPDQSVIPAEVVEFIESLPDQSDGQFSGEVSSNKPVTVSGQGAVSVVTQSTTSSPLEDGGLSEVTSAGMMRGGTLLMLRFAVILIMNTLKIK